jgi:hypothetical protein
MATEGANESCPRPSLSVHPFGDGFQRTTAEWDIAGSEVRLDEQIGAGSSCV